MIANTENGHENELRSDFFKKNPENEVFLKLLNDHLSIREELLINDINIDKRHPIYFVAGLPRSGTTLVSQILTSGRGVGYINNFIARFWKCPLVGIKLFQSIYANREVDKYSTFNSNLGATQNIYDIHEFGYFWQHWLNIDEYINNEEINDPFEKINWDGLNLTLESIVAVFNKPLIMRNNLGFHHALKFSQKIEKIKWIYVERDPIDVACSIFEARKRYYKDLTTFWGTKPPNYDQYLSLAPEEQILNQVCELRQLYNTQIKELPKSSVVRVAFDDVVNSNGTVLKDLGIPFVEQPKISIIQNKNKYNDHHLQNFFLRGISEYESRHTPT